MTKILVNRMKLLLEGVISKNQRAFILGWYITDNVLFAFELGHYIKRRTEGKKGFAYLKIDMEKA